MGMRGFGEIDYLARIVRPDIAVITNIGISHIERLGSRQNILKAKLEIIRGMKDDGVVILNGDDELLSGLRGLLKQNTLFYGMEEFCDVRASDLLSREKGNQLLSSAQDPRTPVFCTGAGDTQCAECPCSNQHRLDIGF